MPLGRLVRLAGEPAGDAELLDRFRAGRDEAAFAELVRRHGPLVRGVCRRVLGPADADDAAQAVFLVLARNAGRVRDPDALAGFLHGVSVRVCRKALARRPKPVPPTRPPAADPADEASWREVAAAVDDALARLPDRLRQPLVLCYLQGLTRDEAAARLGWPVATLRGRLDRGRARLRADLARRGFGLPAGLLAVLLSSPRGDAAGWAAGTVQAIFDPAGPPAAVAALTVGVGWAMRTKLTLGLAVALGLAGGLTMAPGRPADDPPPKAAGPVRPKFEGRWEAVQEVPDGSSRRTFSLDVTDGQHLLRRVAVVAPGVNTSGTVRCRYSLTDTELALTGLERWSGEEPVPLRAEDKAGQRYAIRWGTADGKPWLELTPVGVPDAQAVRYTPAVPPPPAEVPEPLRGERKPPVKEPKYRGQPLYLELAFGPKAALRVWLVLDGDRVFLDRNGNGDLTDDDGSPVAAMPFKGPAAERAGGGSFLLGAVGAPGDGPDYGELVLTAVRLGDGRAAAMLRVRIDGKHDQRAGLTDMLLAADPKVSRVVHFDADRWAVRPAVFPPAVPTAGQPAEFAVLLGTPGIGPGSFVTRANFDLPADKNPVGEFRFPGVAVPVRVAFDRRGRSEFGVWDRFVGTVTVPAGAGKGPAKLTLSFPDCPVGAVPPAEYEVWYHPKPADKTR